VERAKNNAVSVIEVNKIETFFHFFKSSKFCVKPSPVEIEDKQTFLKKKYFKLPATWAWGGVVVKALRY
jgi:hypothetical protein